MMPLYLQGTHSRELWCEVVGMVAKEASSMASNSGSSFRERSDVLDMRASSPKFSRGSRPGF